METFDTIQNKKGKGGKCGVVLVILAILLISSVVFIFVYYNFIKQYPEDNPVVKIAEKEVQIPPAPQEKLMEYFDNIAFNKNDGRTYKNIPINNLWKWEKKQVSIELSGDYNQSVVDVVNKFIGEFNDISTSTKLISVTTGGDIKIKFLSREKLAGYIKDPEKLSMKFYAWAENQGKCEITSATVYMQNEYKDYLDFMIYTVGHELFHALGFNGHDTGGKYCNYMTPIPCGPIKEFSQYDEFAVKSAYSSGATACESKTVVLKRLKGSAMSAQ